uniref:Uncharacterized protein n=1 Tax=Glossina austeni TaxID=7395 RepID=A0A1A9UG09_GLOAU
MFSDRKIEKNTTQIIVLLLTLCDGFRKRLYAYRMYSESPFESSSCLCSDANALKFAQQSDILPEFLEDLHQLLHKRREPFILSNPLVPPPPWLQYTVSGIVLKIGSGHFAM